MAEIDVEQTEPGSAAWWEAHAQRLERRRPRAGGLTVERIVDEALALVDREGIDSLTVRRLAERLGTSSATLYRHVASVEELRVLVTDRVLGEIELPDDARPARERVLHLAAELRRVLREHPDVVPALRAGPLLGPNAMRGAERGFTDLLATGVPAEVAIPGYLAMIDFVLGSVFFDSCGAAARHRTRGQLSAIAPTDGITSDSVFSFAAETFLDGLLHASNAR